MKQLIQHIIFPDDVSLTECRELFYRGDHGRLTEIGPEGHLCLGKNQFAEFCTYLNGVSVKKWRRYTEMKELALNLDIQGTAEITLCGYALVQNEPIKTFSEQHWVDAQERKIITLLIPNLDCMIAGFELSATTDVELYGGYYEAEFPDESERPIELAITTTTFHREDYVCKNAKRILNGIINRYPEIGQHVLMHVVDNGRTLVDKDLPEDSHFILHPNSNAGGSGGFARGMIECLHQRPAATHMLLMDDDILILPESLYRTYQLLRVLKPEYHRHFIGGAMLRMEKKNMQHSDVGCIIQNGSGGPVKPKFDHYLLTDNLRNELNYPAPNYYQGWWYCCMPVEAIRENGLPLPVFVRADDTEHALRNKAQVITMNGICLWHLGFEGKFSPAVSIYQEYRNKWIGQAVGSLPGYGEQRDRFKHKFREAILRYDYVSCEMYLRAMEDYLKGPEFFMVDRGEKILKENTGIHNKMVPFEDLPIKGLDFRSDPYKDIGRKRIKTLLYRLTWNGQMLCPQKLISNSPVLIPQEHVYTPGKIALKRTHVAINSVNRTACVWELDQAKFKSLYRRYRETLKRYDRNHEEVRKAWMDKRELFRTEEFWRNFLNLDQHH